MANAAPIPISSARSKRKRKPLTTQQRNIKQAERSGIRAVRAKYQARTESEKEILSARYSAETAAYRDIEGQRTKGYYKRHVGTRAIGAVASATRPVANPVLLIILTMAGLIIFYLIVTSAQNFSGFLGSLQRSLTKLSTTSPLFAKNTTDSGETTAVAFTPSSSNTA